MTVSIAFAIIGAVILIGFFANLLFRATKIPSVLLLIAIGVALGPVTGWITSRSLIEIAPFFGTMALLIILFEGGLELDIESVIRQAPIAALLAILVFFFSTASVAAFAFFALQMSLFHSLLIAAIFSAGSPAICLPVISGLSIKKEVKTILKLESTLGDVLLIVTVLLVLDFQAAGSQSPMEMASRFVASFVVALVVATIAGVVWSRLIGWMGKEPLAYMLTLGFVFLLYFSVEELGGSAAMAVLIFGILLENMHVIAGRARNRMRYLFGIDVRAEQFILHEFMKNITEELSFLVRTFFFVYLGLILNFRSVTLWIAATGAGIVLLLLISRWAAVQSIRKRGSFSPGESQIVLSMLPRGLATAVMSFIPAQYGVSGTDYLPIYAFTVIVLTNVLMTAGVVIAERRLSRESVPGGVAPGAAPPSPPAQEEGKEKGALRQRAPGRGFESRLPPPAMRPKLAPAPLSFTDFMARLFGIPSEEREWRYIEAIKASSLAQPRFWIQIFFAAALTALGLVINQSAIIIGAALIVPIAWPVIAAGMALVVGNVYLFFKLFVKLALVVAMTTALAAVFSALLPFSAFTAEIASRTKPTILDFIVAFFAGMAGAVMLFSRKRMLEFFPGAVLAVTLMPPLAVMGFGLGSGMGAEIFKGSAVLFTANFFAAILGASLVYAVVGMPAVAGLKDAHDWRQRELSHPVVGLIFKSLRLSNLAGRTGSVRSRLVVAAVFLLALVIPLQMAFNQLSAEFRARQAIAEVQKMFEVPGRSAIINSTSNIGEDAIAVRIQAATNSFFSSADIRRFEERISDRTGKPARLDLVQSLSDMGSGRKIGAMLNPLPAAPVQFAADIPEMTADLRGEIEKSLRAASLPSAITLLRVGAEFDMSGLPATYRVEYLAEAPLTDIAGDLLTGLLERQMKLPGGSIRLMQVPSLYSIGPGRSGGIGAADEARVRQIQQLLTQYPGLGAKIELPGFRDEKYLNRLRTALYDLAPILANSARAEMLSAGSQNSMLAISLRPMPAASYENGIGSKP